MMLLTAAKTFKKVSYTSLLWHEMWPYILGVCVVTFLIVFFLLLHYGDRYWD